jgi:hypothetical protein
MRLPALPGGNSTSPRRTPQCAKAKNEGVYMKNPLAILLLIAIVVISILDLYLGYKLGYSLGSHLWDNFNVT